MGVAPQKKKTKKIPTKGSSRGVCDHLRHPPRTGYDPNHPAGDSSFEGKKIFFPGEFPKQINRRKGKLDYIGQEECILVLEKYIEQVANLGLLAGTTQKSSQPQ